MYPLIKIKSSKIAPVTKIRHPWIFHHAIGTISGDPKKLHGNIVSVYAGDEFVGHGTYSSEGTIAVRLFNAGEKEDIRKEYIPRCIENAFALRKEFVLSSETNACRLIHGEGDYMPGLIADWYNGVIVLQIGTAGMYALLPEIVSALQKICKPSHIILALASTSSEAGLDIGETPRMLAGDAIDSHEIMEQGISYRLSFSHSQKTGFFLDQRDNRFAIQKYADGAKVLNLYSFTGGFSLHALKGGARNVVSVDSSAPALEAATANMLLNKIDAKKHEEVKADALEYLKTVSAGSFDMIILDPPAFVKHQRDLAQGMKKYLTANALALQALKDGGILATCSCSSAITPTHFSNILNWASRSVNCRFQIMEKRGAGLDHPVLPEFPEGEYLKVFIGRKRGN